MSRKPWFSPIVGCFVCPLASYLVYTLPKFEIFSSTSVVVVAVVVVVVSPSLRFEHGFALFVFSNGFNRAHQNEAR